MTRWLRFLLLVLILGLLTTVGVAWAAAAWGPPPRRLISMHTSTSLGRLPAQLAVYEARRWGGCRRGWFAEPSMGCGNPYMSFVAPFTKGAAPKGRPDGTWGDYPAFEAGFRTRGGFGIGYEDGAGWPRVALWCTLDPRRATVVPKGGLQVGSDQTYSGLLAYRVLPYRPVWEGLATNTLVFAGAWGLLLVVPWRLRSRRRRGEGLCAACGYDRSGLTAAAVCPECGSPATPAPDLA